MLGKILLNRLLIGLVVLVTALALLVGCDSSDTDSNSEPDAGTQFAADESNSGSISLSVSNNQLAVGGTSSFFVTARDENGAPIPNLRLACDTEQGLALLEPTTGLEITSGDGRVSGRVGCETSGSFRMGCRMPFAGRRREFETIKCSGTTPPGFVGFAGAGGGTLGSGGAVDVDTGGGEFDIRLTAINFTDGGQSGTFFIDTDFIPDCDGDASTVDPETYTDTVVNFSVKNNTSQIVRIISYTYRVFGFNGSTFNSGLLNFIGEVSIGAGDSASFSALFAKAVGGGKRFFDTTTDIGSPGFLNLEFDLVGTNLAGEAVEVSARTAVSFDGYNRCTG